MATLRHVFLATSTALMACSPQAPSEENATAPSQPAVRSKSAEAEEHAPKPTVVLVRNLKPGAIKPGKPLPRERIVLNRGQRIDVLDKKGTTSFVGPVTIGPDGETISGGSGQEGGYGFGSVGNRIIDIGGVRIESSRAAQPDAMPPPPPETMGPAVEPPK